MINKKSIIILIVAVAVLAGAFFVSEILLKEEKEPITFESTSTEIFTVEAKSIVRMDLTIDDESFAFARSGEQWVLVGQEDVEITSSDVEYLCGELAGIYSKQLIAESADDLSIYGFDKPIGTYKITMSDGSTKTFLLGNRDPITGQYYFKISDSPTVYTLYPTKGDSIYKKSEYYKNSNIMSVNIESLTKIELVKPQMKLVLEGKKGEDGTTTWYMKSPMNRPADSEQVHKNIVSKLSYIQVDEFVDDRRSEQERVGVLNPMAVLTLTDASGATQTINVGKKEELRRYVKVNERVYLIDGNSISFVDTDPFIYVNKFVSLQKIDDVKTVAINAKGKTHIAEIEGTGETARYKLDGTEVMETKFKREFYQKVIGLMADDFAEAPKYTAPEYEIVFYMKDGTVKKSEYCVYDDRNYAVYNDGSCEFIIRKKKLDEMLASIEGIGSERAPQSSAE